MATLLTEGTRATAHLVSEANGYQSRDAVTIAAGADLPAATVLGKVTASGKYVALVPAAADGSQNAVAVLYASALAASGDVAATVTARWSEVNGNLLVWPASITAPQKTAALASLATVGIIVRT